MLCPVWFLERVSTLPSGCLGSGVASVDRTLDEREAREAARRHDVRITGAIGVLLWGSQHADVDIEQALDDLRSAGFWIGDGLYERAIRRADDDSES